MKPWSCCIIHPILSTVPHSYHTNNDLSISMIYIHIQHSTAAVNVWALSAQILLLRQSAGGWSILMILKRIFLWAVGVWLYTEWLIVKPWSCSIIYCILNTIPYTFILTTTFLWHIFMFTWPYYCRRSPCALNLKHLIWVIPSIISQHHIVPVHWSLRMVYQSIGEFYVVRLPRASFYC